MSTSQAVPLPGFPAPPPPDDAVPERTSAGRKRTERRRRQLAAGINPGSGHRLAGNGETCRTCVFLVRQSQANTWFKCGKGVITGGEATDIRVGWPACVLWQSAAERKP